MNVPEIFGSMTFNETVMRERLPEETYNALSRNMKDGIPLSLEQANVVAGAMKDWAIEKGATHYTHWFQPMTGVTAEKHESFIAPSGKGDGKIIMEFSGKELIKGESDASSFPSGGLRATFEARGYTAWDPTSYAFIKDGVLCIPTAFCSYGGEALDEKTPLLRSMEAINTQAMRILSLFGTECSRVYPTMGPEQEYFLIDRDRYNQRKDIIYTGRTLIGTRPPKGQELDDYYYGSIKIRVSAFMKELNEELWKLGILAKTEHNEAAPAQHELAPLFTKVNVSVDHNQVTMELMRKIAKRHGLTCLFHEKPFEGINGSGKHNNWSLATDTGINLLQPGDTPEKNAQFLLFLCAVIKAADEYQDLLRIAASSAGNDCRLGGNEAPPTIMSVYVGDELEAIIDSIVSGEHYDNKIERSMKIGVDALPEIPRDNSDRNRTSPFAFTGNKFEFRTLGAAMSCASVNTVLDTIVANSLCEFADVLETAEDFGTALNDLIRETCSKHKRILFSGNGYDESWAKEARKRGLMELSSTADAVPHLCDRKNVKLFEKFGVFSRTELTSRRDIMLENYCKQVNIEAMVLSEMVRCDILPAVIGFQKDLADAINAKRAAMPGVVPCAAERAILTKTATLCDKLYDKVKALDAAITKVGAITDMESRAKASREQLVTGTMAQVRSIADELETLVSKDAWPYPSYGKLLYRV